MVPPSAKEAHENLDDVLATFITASHVLHYHGALDAFGHVSVRNPKNDSTFFMSCSIAPALISSKDDLVEYHIDDANPVNSDSRKGYLERYIHSEVLKRFPGVNSVIHSHCSDVLPYCINDVPLKPAIHMAGFLGTEVPVYNIAHHYQSGDSHDFLLRSKNLGEALAGYFSKSQATYVKVGTSIVNRITGSHAEAPRDPDHNVVLMQGHGFATAARTIEQAVYQAIYTQAAAKAQTMALITKNAYSGAKLNGKVEESGSIKQASIDPIGELHYLDASETTDASAMNRSASSRAWQLWEREVSVSPLYINELKKAG